jgi:LmbE family N-acetylglucosaminyl deacetylase
MTLDVNEHLAAEIAAPDPWRLESNPFEHKRYALMLNMIRAHGRFERALEVGCAGGFFTGLLAPLCGSLHVVDILPEAVMRAAARLKGQAHVTFEAASVTDDFAAGRQFDLIVVSEVLCYLPDAEILARTVAKLAARLAPDGLLVFGSAVDATCRRWGLMAGAETAMREWEKCMRQIDQTGCTGAYWGEDCRIVAYTNGKPPREDSFAPHKAIADVPAAGVLVLAPHPDDEVFGCGGAILRHVENNVPVRVVIATDGGARGARADARKEESRAAARILGYGEPVFWDQGDRTLCYSEELVAAVLAEMQDADLVYAPGLDELHPDHRALGLAAAEAVRRQGGKVRLAFYEIGGLLKPNVLLDISQAAARKNEAMQCFASQLGTQRYDQQIAALNRYRTYTLAPAVTAAEAFHLVWAEELARDPLKFHWAAQDRRMSEAADRSLRRDLAEAQRALEAMRASSSWRVTAPLRAFSRMVRGLGRGS